jgi:hypothetical protein
VIKHFCDSCGKEVSRNTVSERLIGHKQIGGKKIMWEVVVGVGDTWNAGEVCEPCLRGLIAKTPRQ